MPQTKTKDQAIREGIEVLVSQGRDVTTAAILSWLNGEDIKAKSSDVHDSAAWKELLAKEKAEPAAAKEVPPKNEKPKATPTATTTKEKPVAKTEKKPNFPSKICPKCGKLIHARSLKHEACGWVATANGAAAPSAAKPSGGGKKVGRPKKVHAAAHAGGITVADIQAVKHLVDRLGAEKVRDLAAVLTK